MDTKVFYAYVFHRKSPKYSLTFLLGPMRWFLSFLPMRLDGFEPVAHVLSSGAGVDPVDVAFRGTNSSEAPWHQSLGRYPSPVGVAYGGSSRSTTMGDIIVVGNSVWRLEETRKMWTRVFTRVVASIRFLLQLAGYRTAGSEMRAPSTPRRLCSELAALDLIYLIQDPAHMLQGAMLTLADKYQQQSLSFGYIGNLWSTGPVEERDDREWSIFGPRNLRWGRFSTKKLPLMAERARTIKNGKSLLEQWVEAIAKGEEKTAMRLSYAYHV